MITIESNTVYDISEKLFYETKDFYFKNKKKLNYLFYYNPFTKKVSNKYMACSLGLYNYPVIKTEDQYRRMILDQVIADFEKLNKLTILNSDLFINEYEMNVYIEAFNEYKISYLLLSDIEKAAVYIYNSNRFSKKEMNYIFEDIYNSDFFNQKDLNYLYLQGELRHKNKFYELITDPIKETELIRSEFSKYMYIYKFIIIAIFIIGFIPLFNLGYNYNGSIIYGVLTSLVSLPLLYTLIFTILSFTLNNKMHLLFPEDTFFIKLYYIKREKGIEDLIN